MTDETRSREIIQEISKALKQITEERNFSSVHILLANKDEIKDFSQEDFSLRTSYSFHWFNNNYLSFENFLQDMTSRQRKNIKKERKKINDQGITVSRVCGSAITLEMLETFYQFYQVTYLKRGMRGYLNFEFFKEIVKSIPETIMLVLAKNNSGEYLSLIHI